MKSSFWHKLKKPFSVLAPMEDVTDTVFRRIIANCHRPDVFFTEFTSTDGMMSEKGRENVVQRLEYTEKERPLVAQIWGNNPENYYIASKELVERGFDGIDINMGCPVKKITTKGCCSALIENQALAKELILAAKEGASNTPVSVKTRLGFKSLQTLEWASFLLELNLPVLSFHGRIAKHQSKYPANWEEIKSIVNLKNQMKKDTLIIGNGDVSSYQEIQDKHKEYKVDGVMIGRGVFENLYVFSPELKYLKDFPKERKLKLLGQHLNEHQKRWGDTDRYSTMKRFFKIYIKDFSHAAELRNALMETNSVKESIRIIESYP